VLDYFSIFFKFYDLKFFLLQHLYKDDIFGIALLNWISYFLQYSLKKTNLLILFNAIVPLLLHSVLVGEDTRVSEKC